MMTSSFRPLELHAGLQKIVIANLQACKCWDNFALQYDFHETARGWRFTVSESARRDILSRLLRLNHGRWEEEQKVKDEGGMIKDEGKKSKKVKKSKSTDGQMGLL